MVAKKSSSGGLASEIPKMRGIGGFGYGMEMAGGVNEGFEGDAATD